MQFSNTTVAGHYGIQFINVAVQALCKKSRNDKAARYSTKDIAL